MDPLACEFDTAHFLIFSDNVFAPLIYYSHLGPLIASLLIGIAVLVVNHRALVNRSLFVITISFAVWVYFDLILWANEKPEYIMFFWSALAPIELFIYASSWYLVSVLANGGRGPSLREQLLVSLTFLPVFLFAHTQYNLLGYDASNCDRAAIEGPLWQYIYLVELFFVAWIARIAYKGYFRLSVTQERMSLLVVSVGAIIFLLLFFAGNITLLLSLDWSYEQYKLFGMPVLAAFIAYSAIRFKTFDLKIFTAQALVIGVSVLVFSLLFIRTIQNVRIVTAITFVLICLIGYILVRNVRKEIEQRELIEKQEKELEIINKEQENLLHFISHEVKGYLTKSEAGFAAINEETFGPISPDLKKMSGMALAEMRKGVDTVMDILNASDLKKGTVNYSKKPFDFKEAVLSTLEELRPSAEEKNLKLSIDMKEGSYTIEGDADKLRLHTIRNLIDNAIKYTPVGGTITVTLSSSEKMVRFAVADSGVGITKEDMARLFTEGGHGKDSLKVNIHSTGYGLYIAKKIVEAHGGKIWAESEGQGKGSRFVVELPTQ